MRAFLFSLLLLVGACATPAVLPATADPSGDSMDAIARDYVALILEIGERDRLRLPFGRHVEFQIGRRQVLLEDEAEGFERVLPARDDDLPIGLRYADTHRACIVDADE